MLYAEHVYDVKMWCLSTNNVVFCVFQNPVSMHEETPLQVASATVIGGNSSSAKLLLL